ncbi:cysteine--tRNA ligase [Candidatus Parcubacteria bacterium]|nr:cysteine--tRNA ligase [Candidatus Parcubacteria bacterium]
MSFLDFFFTLKPSNLPPLEFKNTLSGNLEVFEPINGAVKMYNCGPTVYDRQHIGNMRPYVFADLIRRTLAVWGFKVKQVINITDVGHLVSDADEGEDKMEKSAKAAGRKAQDIAKEITELFFQDLDELGIERTKIEFPRATQYIDQQIALVKGLEEKGYAYKISDGMYFDTAKFPQYGKLGHIDLKGLEAGARVEENMEKRNPHDFALWKFSKTGEKRQQEWKSPWGKGFPGWHIECTAMIFEILGKQIDIHTGGVDHIPVHHNNEIAQAEALTHKQYAKYWMHNEHITIEGKKISKSLGNTVYLQQLTDKGFSPRSLRYWFLTSHYRTPANFTWEAIEGANTALRRLMTHYHEAPAGRVDQDFMQKFYTAIANDLDTPKALALVWENIKMLNKQTLAQADKVLGLLDSKQQKEMTVIPDEVQALANEREEARTAKNFARSDELRQAIEDKGFMVKDTSEGPKLSKK